MSEIIDRLTAAGIAIPRPVAPVANYVPFVITGSLLFISGQVSVGPDGLLKGRVGETLSLEDGQRAARYCAINLIAQAQAALGDLSRVARVVKLGAFVNCAAGFVEIPKVANGCSDVMVLAFGDQGRHARSAVACPELPLGAAVEVDAVMEIA